MNGGRKETRITIQVDPKLKALAEQAIFIPTASHKKAKHRFLEKWDGVADPTCNQAISWTRMTMMTRWWSQPGFLDWLTNQESMTSRINYLSEIALDAAEEILLDPEAGAVARGNMIKVVLGFKHVMESQTRDSAYADLSQADLIKLIKQKQQLLQPVIDAEADDEK